MLTYQDYAQFRDAKGMSDYKIANELGLSRTTLWNWQKDVCYPRLDTLISICDLLEIPRVRIVE